MAALEPNVISKILSLYDQGVRPAGISLEMKLHKSTVYGILRRERGFKKLIVDQNAAPLPIITLSTPSTEPRKARINSNKVAVIVTTIDNIADVLRNL